MKIILHDTFTNDEYGIRVCERDFDRFTAMLQRYNASLPDNGIEIIAIERFFQPSEYKEI